MPVESPAPSDEPVRDEPVRDEAVIGALAQLIEMGADKDEFTLGTVQYESRAQRRDVIARLRRALPEMRLVRVSLQNPALRLDALPVQFFEGIERLARKKGGDGYDAVFVTDWEKRLDLDQPASQQPRTSLTETFNQGRNHIAEILKCPVIVFLPHEAMALVQEMAADFISWRSGRFTFDFEPEELEDVEEEKSTETEPRDVGDWWTTFHGATALDGKDSILGREEDLEDVLDKVLDTAFRCGTFWGETGCGKTSFVRAGLMPALDKADYRSIYLRRYDGLGDAVRTEMAREAGLEEAPATLLEAFEAASTEGRLFVFLDQFEDIYSGHYSGDEIEAFLEELIAVMDDRSLDVRVIFMLRADRLWRFIADFDRLKEINHPFNSKARYELGWLHRRDAERVLTCLGEEAGVDWNEELVETVIEDLEGKIRRYRVRPVEVQLVGTALFLRGVRSVAAYEEAGRKSGLLKDYLDTVLDDVGNPELGRRVVRRLVGEGEPLARLARSLDEIVSEARGKRANVERVLDGLGTRHVVQSFGDEAERRFELVHDVLCDPCWRATTPQEMGLSVLRKALQERRRVLTPREYWRVLRCDIDEMPRKRQRAVRRILRWTKAAGASSLLLMICLLVIAIQFSTAHVRIEADPPNAVRVYRGIRTLQFLPAPFAQTALYDTGLTDRDVPATQRNLLFELKIVGLVDSVSSRIERLHNHVELLKGATRLCSLGNWVDGVPLLMEASAETRQSPYTWSRDRTPAFVSAYEEVAPGNIPFYLLRRLKDDNPYVRIATATTLVRIASQEASTVVPQLLPLLEHDDPKIREEAASALGEIVSQDASIVVSQLLPLLRDSIPNVRGATASALGNIAARDASTVVPQLVPLLEHNDAYVRSESARALGKIASQHASMVVPQLLPLLKDSAPKVRGATITALGQIASQDASMVVQQLLPLLKDREIYFFEGPPAYTVSDTAVSVLVKIDSRDMLSVAPHLVPLLKDDDAYGRIAISKVLVELDGQYGSQMVALLVPLLKNNDAYVRRKSARALGEIGSQDAPVVITKLLPLLKDDDYNVRFATTRTLGKIAWQDGSAVVPQLLPLLKDNHRSVRYMTAKVLGEIGSQAVSTVVPQLLPLLKDYNSDNNSFAHRASAEALLKLDDMPFLTDLAGDESRLDGRYRESLVHGLAFWLHAGRPPDKANDTTDVPGWQQRAREDYPTLRQELDRLRQLKRPWWLRVAAWDVLMEAYEMGWREVRPAAGED